MATTAARKRKMRIRRHARVRKHISGTAARPRLAVFRSGRHISAQVIDDTAGRTLASAATVEARREELRSSISARTGPDGAFHAVKSTGAFVASRR